MNTNNLKRGIKLLFLAAMVCFFFPFVMVSCSGESVEATGFELATNISMHEEIKFDDEDTPNPYLIAGFICGLLGFGIAWKITKHDKKALVSGCFAAAGAAFLLLFRSTFWDFYELTGYKGRVTVEFRWGWMLSLVAYIGAAGVSLLSYLGNMSDDYVQSSPVQRIDSTTDGYEYNNISLDSVPECIVGEVQSENICTQQLVSGEVHLPSDVDTSEQLDASEQLPEDICLPKVVICGKFKMGEVQEWRPKEFPCFIGRDSSVVQIAVPDSCVSRIHARLYIESGLLMLADEGSSNGTIVNGEKISSPIELLSGDQVTVGKTILCFEISER